MTKSKRQFNLGFTTDDGRAIVFKVKNYAQGPRLHMEEMKAAPSGSGLVPSENAVCVDLKEAPRIAEFLLQTWREFRGK